MTNRSRLMLVIGIALFAGLFVLAAAPTLVQWSVGGFQDQNLFASTSPDGKYRIDGFVSVDFPANEMLDPSGTLRITLWDSHSGKPLDQLFVGLFEADDFQKPTVIWQPDGHVEVHDMEGKNHRLSATLDVHAWDVPK